MPDSLFADTVFWVALLRPRDEHHAAAVAWQQHVVQHGASLVTTEAVLWEALNAFAAAGTRQAAADFYQRAHADPAVQVVGFDPALIRAAVELYASRPDKCWSITDCYSLR